MNDYRRSGTAHRAFTLAPQAPSQDVSRYQARVMPAPTFDLERDPVPASLLTILVRALAVVGTGAGIVVIQRLGNWLAP